MLVQFLEGVAVGILGDLELGFASFEIVGANLKTINLKPRNQNKFIKHKKAIQRNADLQNGWNGYEINLWQSVILIQ